jgi:hypothetical protein
VYDSALDIVPVIGFSVTISLAVMTSMVMMMVMMTVPMIVLVTSDRILLLAPLSTVRPNLPRLAMIVVLAIATPTSSNSNLPSLWLLSNDNGCRGSFLEDDFLFGSSLANDDGSGSWLIVLSLFPIALDLRSLIAAFLHPTFYANFVAMGIPALNPPLDAHLSVLVFVPVGASFPLAWRVDITVPLDDLSLYHRARPLSLGRIHITFIALDNPLPLDHGTSGAIAAVLDPVHTGVVFVSGLSVALALALIDLALDIRCAVRRRVDSGPGSLRNVQAFDAAVDLHDVILAGAANRRIAGTTLLLNHINLALDSLYMVWRDLVAAHCSPLVTLVLSVGRVPVPLPHVAGLAVHVRHAGWRVSSHPAVALWKVISSGLV